MPLPVISRTNLATLKAVQVSKKSTGGWDLFECRPVWIVGLRDGTKLVVKQEVKNFETAQKSAVFGAKIMKNIDGETRAAVLTDNEVNLLANIPTFRMGGVGLPAPASDICREYLRHCKMNPSGIWIKMAFVDNLVGLDKVFENEMNTRNLLLDMRVDYEICHSLGEVIAGDIFIGNEDRFTHSGPNIGQIVNTGNILFKAKHGTKGIGLDWFQAQGEFSNLYAAPGAGWNGRLLNDDTELIRFSKRAISELNGGFSDKLEELQPPDLLTEYNVNYLKDGIVSGREKLKAYLVGKIEKDATNRTNKVPGGVKIRMQILGWLA